MRLERGDVKRSSAGRRHCARNHSSRSAIDRFRGRGVESTHVNRRFITGLKGPYGIAVG